MSEQVINVAVYDPGSPGAPAQMRAANFNPLIHVRWEQRPAAQAVDLRAALAPEGDDGPDIERSELSEEHASALAAAGVGSVLDVLRAGVDGLRGAGLTAKVARAVHAWASDHEHAEAARTELVTLAAARAAARAAGDDNGGEGATSPPASAAPADAAEVGNDPILPAE